jgi:ApeA N-terminal domain 1
MTNRPPNIPVKTVADWFVPEEPSHRISGVLEYDGQLSMLNLSESFDPSSVKSPPVMPRAIVSSTAPPVNLGEVSLFDAVQLGLGFNIVQGQVTQPERLRATMLIIGRHVDPDALIRCMDFRIPGLEIWLSRQVIWTRIAPPTKESPRLPDRSYRGARSREHCGSHDRRHGQLRNSCANVDLERCHAFFDRRHGHAHDHLKHRPNLGLVLDHHAYVEALIGLLAGAPMPVDQIQARFNDETVDGLTLPLC